MRVNELINRDLNCSCGRTHRCDFGAVEIGRNKLEMLPEILAGKKAILLVADGNTWPLCGEKVKALLGDRVKAACVFPGTDIVVPNEESIAYIEKFLTPEIDFALGIGSGVINDLCKYVSYTHDFTSGIIATAPSMDGYASSGAAMILGGMKVTLTMRAPEVIVGDVALLAGAPMDMIRSGYGDIIGKYSALCDWKLAHLITGEYLCPEVYKIVMDATDEVRALAGRIVERDPEAIGRLMEILVLIGVTLTLLSTTRPGSGSEHHLSHYFEITGLIDDKPYFLHGTDVGYATVVTAGLREKLVKVDRPVFRKIPREAREAAYKAIYKGFAGEVMKLQDEAGSYERDLSGVYEEKWDEVRALLSECPGAAEIQRMLEDVGFDMGAFERMYGAKKIQDGVWFGKDLKDRYSVLWPHFLMFYEG